MKFQREKFKNIVVSFYDGEGVFPIWPPKTVFDLIQAVVWSGLVGWFLFPIIFFDCLELE